MTQPQRATQGILLTLAYQGGPFHGFVLQSNARSVAEELLKAAHQCDPHITSLRCVSRTDAGVHAYGQLVAFDTNRVIAPRGWVLALNRCLPKEISVRYAAHVPVGFDPRGYVLQKWYRYSLLRDVRRDPFLDATSWRVYCPLDLELARAEAHCIVGTHDFAAFRSSSDCRDCTVRTINQVSVYEEASDPRLVVVDVRGSAFLHNMVRIIVGSLYDVARGQLPPGTIARALSTGDRRILGVTAPPHGLCLMSVELEGIPEPAQEWPTSCSTNPPRSPRVHDRTKPSQPRLPALREHP